MCDMLLATIQPLLAVDLWSNPFLLVAGAIALIMLLWDTIEVGRNDAANLVNAVFGSRVLRREHAVWVAGIGVVLGAVFASPVMETARKGIFDPTTLTILMALSVYVSVYIVDTVLLYGYSAFGMPVSTTACLVFELLGASFVLGLFERPGTEVVSWSTAGKVVIAIICSIFITGVSAFFIQRAVRGAIRDRTTNLAVLLAHGGWVGGGMLAGLTYFMIVKGMKQVAYIKWLNTEVVQAYGPVISILVLWAVFAALIHMQLVVFGKRAARMLFPILAIIGMVSMAFAFGQNDLANCASPGLAALNLIRHWDAGIVEATGVSLPVWALAGCGVLLVIGMATRNAQRVTKAEVHAGSTADNVTLYAPNWCQKTAKFFLRFGRPKPRLAPPPVRTREGKLMHYDPLRACVILSVSASVIATASGFGLPVSTTYVAFAAVVATGAADRIFQAGDAELKIARMVWVVFSWFAAAFIAAAAAGAVCLLVYKAGVWGMILGVGANLATRRFLKKRADAQQARVKAEARKRREQLGFDYPQMPEDDDDDEPIGVSRDGTGPVTV